MHFTVHLARMRSFFLHIKTQNYWGEFLFVIPRVPVIICMLVLQKRESSCLPQRFLHGKPSILQKKERKKYLILKVYMIPDIFPLKLGEVLLNLKRGLEGKFWNIRPLWFIMLIPF